MDAGLQREFQEQWARYFGPAELPLAFFYTDEVSEADRRHSQDGGHCVVARLARVREGHTFVYGADSPGCLGWKRYTGFSQTLRPRFEYFLSCGIPGELEGERYKKSPDLVKPLLESRPGFEAPGRWLVFKRWDKLAADDRPLAVVFFAPADVLSGLFTLANFDRADPHGVIAPMGSGCSTIVHQPYLEARSEAPRCVLGMFDVSARPHVPAAELTFAVPMARFEQMVANMDESFLITKSWRQVRERIRGA
jgi:hypothetical protein